MEPAAFTSHNDACRRSVVHFRVAFFRRFIQTNKPIPCLFEIFHGTRKVGDLGDREMRECASRCARDRVCEPGGAAFGDDNAVSTSSESGADDGAEIVRIFDTVEKNDQTLL